MKTAPTSGAVIIVTLFALSGCAATGGGADPKAIVGPDKVVHHINVTGAQGANALRNVNNHFEENPRATIMAVAHAQGMDFLFDGRRLARAEGRRCARCA